MEINLSAEDIEKLVKEAILKSGFGAAVESGLKTVLDRYDSPVQTELKKYVSSVMQELLNQEPFKTKVYDTVKATLAERLEDQVVTDLCNKAVDRIISRDY